jgi:exodeoxyribonuclease-3
MKIISYNVNGIRAAISKGFIEWLKQVNPDVVCLQEIKASPTTVIGFRISRIPLSLVSSHKKGYSE